MTEATEAYEGRLRGSRTRPSALIWAFRQPARARRGGRQGRPDAGSVPGKARWAFVGEPGHGVLRGPDGAVVDPVTIDWMPEFLRKANQLTEMMLLAGPGDEETGELREHYGYRPDAMDAVEADRLEWEASYVEILAEHPASKAELRVRLQVRELWTPGTR